MSRRWWIGFLFVMSAVGLPLPASASDGESIRALHVVADVRADGSVRFTETILYDFGVNDRHGIIRAIPLWDDLPDGKRRRYQLVIGTVTQDGHAVPVDERDEGAFRMLTIGDPDLTITGEHLYTIQFSITNALTPLSKADLTNAPGVAEGDVELYWDFIGNGWQVPILSGDAVVQTPAAPLLVRCYSGPTGSTNTCTQSAAETGIRLGPVSVLPGEALTGVITMPRSAFTHIAVPDIIDRPAPWQTQFSSAFRFTAPLGGLLLTYFILRARRRRASVQTVPVHDFVVFEPPLGLHPAEMAVAWRGRFDGRVLTATLLDLAARGAILLTPSKRKRIVIDRSGRQVTLTDWEQHILTALLHDAESAEVGKYDAKVASAVKTAGAGLKERALTTGIRNKDAWKARTPWIALCSFGALITFGSPATAVLPALCAAVLSLGLAMLIGGAIGWKSLPLVQTERSADFLSQVQGFRKLLDTDAAAARREFAHRSGLEPAAIFATMLPFAVIYGVDEAWAGAFPDLTPAQLSAYGLGFASAQSLHHDVASVTRALSSAMTNPSSGGSGSSGGSSGGGGGGGGGGSW